MLEVKSTIEASNYINDEQLLFKKKHFDNKDSNEKCIFLKSIGCKIQTQIWARQCTLQEWKKSQVEKKVKWTDSDSLTHSFYLLFAESLISLFI